MTDNTSNGKYPPGYFQDGPLAGKPIPGHPAAAQEPGEAPPAATPEQTTPATDDADAVQASEQPKKPRRIRRLPRRPKKKGPPDAPDTTAADEAPSGSDERTPEMHVPRPGGKIRDDRRTTVAVRVAVISGATLAALSSCAIGGLAATTATRAVANADNITRDQLDKFHVSTFDTTGAAAFAGRYLDACLTRYDINKDTPEPPEEQQRLSTIQTMSAAGEDASCESGDVATKRSVVSATLASKPAKISGVPNGYFITMQVRTTDGATSRYSVPISFTDPSRAAGPRVVGSVGVLPLPQLGSVNPDRFAERVSDDQLASQLQTQFLPEFMTAWVSSERSLPQFLAPGATSTARTGLHRAYSKPKLVSVSVYPPKSAIEESGSKTEFNYSDNTTIEVAVTADMDNAAGNPSRGMGYRLFMIRQGGHWLVKDVQAGVVSTVAGRKSSAGKDGRPSPAPSASPSASATPAPSSSTPKPKSPAPKSSAPAAKSSSAKAKPSSKRPS